MRRPRQRGPSSADLVRQTRVRTLLCRYGAYSRQLVAKSSSSSESSSALAISRSSNAARSSALAVNLSDPSTWSKSERILHEDADLKLSRTQLGQVQAISRDLGGMDKGLALSAAQYVALALSNGDLNSIEGQKLKEQFLHQLEHDWGFAGSENLSLGRIRITIKRKDNEPELIRRRAELERAELERKRLEELTASRNVQRVQRVQQAQSSAVSSQVRSTQVSSSSTKVVQTRVVKTVKRTVQTVRAA
ncbi:hypothetical protein Ocin01_05178 [Orchesella cincta]|uniref:Uncharacterized protein n=1 Tax=Orchesella cincta TaxID=48709 RepID=A0A1D2N8C5_ORCCI|nr:hypothetical protein Ocin01_05178 [Orchesella cincta]